MSCQDASDNRSEHPHKRDVWLARQLNKGTPTGVTIKIAETKEEFEGAFCLLYEIYSKEKNEMIEVLVIEVADQLFNLLTYVYKSKIKRK